MKDLQTVLDALNSAGSVRGYEEEQRYLNAIEIVKQMMQAEPVAYAKSISDELMNCVDRLGSEYDQVDPRVWKHLLVYAPKLDAEPLAEVGVSTFTWLADRPPSGTKLYAAPQAVPAVCEWKQDADFEMGDTYHSSCGELWSFIDGGPTDNRVSYCHHCGKKVQLAAAPKGAV